MPVGILAGRRGTTVGSYRVGGGPTVGAVAAIAGSSKNTFLTEELPARIRELAARAQTTGVSEVLGTHLDKAIGGLTVAAEALLECTAITQKDYEDVEQNRGNMHATAQEVRDHAAQL